jgi:hypothetical protein
MNLTQVGYLGNAGPVFVDLTSVPGKAIIFLGTISAEGVTLTAKDPQYAQNLQALGPFSYSPAQCTLGSYTNNQSVFMSNISYKIPATGGSTFTNYKAVESTWFSYTVNNGQTASSGTTTSNTGGTGLGGILGNTGSTTTNTTTPSKGFANSGIGASLAALIAKSSGSKAAINAALNKQVAATTFATEEEANAAGYVLTKDANGQPIYVPTVLAQAAIADNTVVYWIVGAALFIVAVLLITQNRNNDYRSRGR